MLWNIFCEFYNDWANNVYFIAWLMLYHTHFLSFCICGDPSGRFECSFLGYVQELVLICTYLTATTRYSNQVLAALLYWIATWIKKSSRSPLWCTAHTIQVETMMPCASASPAKTDIRGKIKFGNNFKLSFDSYRFSWLLAVCKFLLICKTCARYKCFILSMNIWNIFQAVNSESVRYQ